MFDTKSVTRKLSDKGIAHDQAEVIADAIGQVVGKSKSDYANRSRWRDIARDPALALNVLNVVAIIAGVVVAVATLRSLYASVDVARDSVDAARQAVSAQLAQLNLSERQLQAVNAQAIVARDALRVEQRAWLRYSGFELQARPTDSTADVPWESREIRQGDSFRVRMSVVNTGMSPALNVVFSREFPRPAAVGSIPRQPEWSVPAGRQRGVVIQPNEQGQYPINFPLSLPQLPNSDVFFQQYLDGELWMFLWARIRYCDVFDRRHAMTVGIARSADNDPSIFTTPEQHMSPIDGLPHEGDGPHPECSDTD